VTNRRGVESTGREERRGEGEGESGEYLEVEQLERQQRQLEGWQYRVY
jgi:hypothetical protein